MVKNQGSVPVICKICENEFELKHFNQKLCSPECKKSSRRIVIKNYKKTNKGIDSEGRWRKSETRKNSQIKYKQSEKEKLLARNRSKMWKLTRHGNLKEWFLKASSNGCNKCGDKRNLSVDHIIPFHLSNDNSLSNLQVLCVPCNGEKGGRNG